MMRLFRRKQPTRAELIERKHHLNGEIRMLRAEIRQLRARNEGTSDVETRLNRLQSLQYRTRHEIDRSEP